MRAGARGHPEPVGGERDALSRVQMPYDVRRESRKANGCRPECALRLQAESSPLNPETTIRELVATSREEKRFLVSQIVNARAAFTVMS